MTANERIENARAAGEAREGVARRSTRGPTAAEGAMKKYLASESYHERRREEQSLAEAATEDDEHDG